MAHTARPRKTILCPKTEKITPVIKITEAIIVKYGM